MSTLGAQFARIVSSRNRNSNKLGRGTRGMPAPLTKRLSQDMRFHHEKVPRAGEEDRAAAEAGVDTSGPFTLSAHKQSYINETAARIKEKDRSFAGQLCAAALLGDASRIALIVQMMEDKRGVDWNQTLRLNPLQLACYSQQRAAVLALLSAGASTTFLIPGARLGWDASALHTACQNADWWFAETLLSAGANVYKAPAAAPPPGAVSGAAARSAARAALAAAARNSASRTALDIALEYRQAGVLEVLAARNVVKNGWLQKQSRALNGLGKWKRRWFECVRMRGGRVLKLQYYKRPTGYVVYSFVCLYILFCLLILFFCLLILFFCLLFCLLILQGADARPLAHRAARVASRRLRHPRRFRRCVPRERREFAERRAVAGAELRGGK